MISSAFETFESKIIERINQGIEIDKVNHILNLLAIYEYSIIRKPTEVVLASSINIVERGESFLTNFAQEVSNISSIPLQDTVKNRRTISEILNIAESKYLKNPNLIICFLSWYLFLSVLFIPISLFLIGVISIKIDSTIIIGILSAPFAAAALVATAVFTKANK